MDAEPKLPVVGVDDETAWFEYLLGIGLCITASCLTQSSNVLVKYVTSVNAKRIEEGLESLSHMAWQNVLYFPLLIGGAVCDIIAMGILPQSLWSGLCCLDILIYTGISKCFLDTQTSTIQWAILVLIGSGVLLTSIGGPGPDHFDRSGIEQLMASKWQEHLLVVPIMFIAFGVAYYICRSTYQAIYADNNDREEPSPMSLYNLSGTFCAAMATMHFQSAVAITTKSIDPFHWGIVLTLAITVVFGALHFHCLWFMIAELHSLSAMPCYIVMTALFHAIYSLTIYQPSYQNAFLYILGIHIMVLALIMFIFVSEYDHTKESTKEKVDEDV